MYCCDIQDGLWVGGTECIMFSVHVVELTWESYMLQATYQLHVAGQVVTCDILRLVYQL